VQDYGVARVTLRIRNVTKRFGNTTAVSGISFEVPEGSIFGLLGANGAGKTTTVRMILDIIRPDFGEVTWQDSPARDVARRRFGYLPEERGLYPDMKVGEQLRFFGRVRGLGVREADDQAKNWLERFGITEYLDRPLQELSKGNQQKVQFLVSVLHDPELVILDEPFSGLDPVSHEQLRAVILELKEGGKTLLLSTHNMEQVEELCDGVALIHRSKLAFSGPLSELRARHADMRTLRLTYDGETDPLLGRFPGLSVVDRDGEELELSPNGEEPKDILEAAVETGRVRRFEEVEPSLRRIFIEEVGRG
jgi:ABC-2 type transport system ATP-binding protein